MNKKILDELEIIRSQGGGILLPEDVVNYAFNEDTALHSKFEWDDGKAGHAYRVWQARHLIKICVTVEPVTKNEIPVYVSLNDERYGDGGYRNTVDVLSDKVLRRKLVEGAIRDFEYWRFRYHQLVELDDVFSAMDDLKKKFK